MILDTAAVGHENLNIYSSVPSISLFRSFERNPLVRTLLLFTIEPILLVKFYE